VLPATLGRICPAPCEKGCRRKEQDDPVAIRSMHRWAGDAAIRAGRPFDLGEPKPATGKRVAIVGAGPAGVATAVYLALDGHAATVFDEHDQAGGALRYAVPAEDLPPEVLDAELAVLAELGVETKLGTRVGRDVAFEELRREYDAVVVATGALEEGADLFGLERTDAGVKADRRTLATPAEGVFAAGDVVRAQRMAVRSVGDAKTVVASLGRFLAGQPVAAPARRFGVRIGKLQEGEITEFMKAATEAARVAPAGGPGAGFTEAEARTEAARCLHCDCRKPETCRLRAVAEACGASATRIKGERPVFRQLGDHPRVLYEPGKCIACGLCVQICERSREPLGLAFIGRGFDVVVGVPLDRSLAEALHEVAEECVRACPTAALAFR
jgi:NADPH-dependent glutamate synthase beta subunit-like oxidoreductase/ferredoxin